MTKTCVICRRQPVSGDFRRSFHKFPRNIEMRQKWMEITGVQNITKVSAVCSDHFDADAYNYRILNKNARRLIPTAVPVVFAKNSVLKQILNDIEIKSPIEEYCFWDENDSESDSLNSPRHTNTVSDSSTEDNTSNCIDENGSQDLVIGISGNTELLSQPKSTETINGNLGVNSKRRPCDYPTLCIKPLSIKPKGITFINSDSNINLSIVKQDVDTETDRRNAPESGSLENFNINAENKLCNVREESVDTNSVKTKVENTDDSEDIHECNNARVTNYSLNNTNIVNQENIETKKRNLFEIKQECTDLGVDYVGIDENSELYFKNTAEIEEDENEVGNYNVFSQTFQDCDCVSQGQIGTIENGDNIANPKDSATYKCNDCDKEFKWKSSLRMHIRIHTGEKPYECPQCDLKFTRSRLLKLHMKKHKGVKHFRCYSCDSAFLRVGELKEHFNSKHSGEKPFKCDICGRHLATKDSLLRHTMKHSGAKPFVCEVCSIRFVTKGELKEHVNSEHIEDKPFKCEICGGRFTTKQSLIRHTNIHIDAKQFVCEVCYIRYNDAYNLRRHMQSHERIARNTCKKCGRVCRNFGALTRHVKVCKRKRKS